MNADQQKELWRWAVHNRTFELANTLSEIRSTFTALGGDAHPPDNLFILHYGEEYAHQKCLEAIGVMVLESK